MNPKSMVVCVFPTGSPFYHGHATVTVTAVSAVNHSRFHTVVVKEVPLANAMFEERTVLKFSYVRKEYVYGSKLCFKTRRVDLDVFKEYFKWVYKRSKVVSQYIIESVVMSRVKSRQR